MTLASRCIAPVSTNTDAAVHARDGCGGPSWAAMTTLGALRHARGYFLRVGQKVVSSAKRTQRAWYGTCACSGGFFPPNTAIAVRCTAGQPASSAVRTWRTQQSPDVGALAKHAGARAKSAATGGGMGAASPGLVAEAAGTTQNSGGGATAQALGVLRVYQDLSKAKLR